MNGLGFWLADKLALALEPHERSAVRGDHSELGSSGLQSAWDVGGLVVRRQLEPWAGWRPWFALVTLVLPFTLLVSPSLDIGRVIARVALFGETSSLPWLFPMAPGIALTLAIWFWTCNFVLAALAGRRALVIQAFFWLLALWQVWNWTHSRLRHDEGLAEIAFGLLAFVLVFAIPALIGLRAGRAEISPSGMVCASLVLAPAAIMALLRASYDMLGPGTDWPLVLLFTWPGLWICSRRYLRSITSAAPCSH